MICANRGIFFFFLHVSPTFFTCDNLHCFFMRLQMAYDGTNWRISWNPIDLIELDLNMFNLFFFWFGSVLYSFFVCIFFVIMKMKQQFNLFLSNRFTNYKLSSIQVTNQFIHFTKHITTTTKEEDFPLINVIAYGHWRQCSHFCSSNRIIIKYSPNKNKKKTRIGDRSKNANAMKFDITWWLY